MRAYQLADAFANRWIADLENSFAPERVFVERIRRDSQFVDAKPDTVLRAGDVIVIMARRRVLLSEGFAIGVEVEERELLDFPMTTADVVVTNRDVVEQTLPTLAEQYGRGVVLQKLIRGEEEIPFTFETTVQRGDLLRIAGATQNVERVGKIFGYIERSSSETDVVFVGLGIFVGGLIGLLSVKVGGLPLSLTASGGSLIMGLVFGWLRSIRPTFGRIPEPALWVFDTIGLAVFHWHRWLERRPWLHHRSARHGSESSLSGFARRRNTARDGAPLRALRVKCKPGHPARRLRGCGNGNGGATSDSG